VLGMNLVHDRKTVCLEGSCCHLLHAKTLIQLWSLYDGHKMRPVQVPSAR
jgi:hypothetical protein